MDQLRTALERSGNRVTGPRQRVWEVISSTDEHLTADEIAERVRRLEPEINLSSVYRSLSLFESIGLVRESALDVGVSHWEVAHSDDHFHIRCRVCAKVEHHEDDTVAQVRRHLLNDHGFDADRVDLVVTGVCAQCRAASH